jgi:type III secretion protein C
MTRGPCNTRLLHTAARAAVLAFACTGIAPALAQNSVAAAQSAVDSALANKPNAVALPKSPSDGIVWATHRFTYKASGKRLSEVLQDFAASQGVPAIVAEGVDGVVHGDFAAPPSVFLNALGKAYGTIWYHDGTTLYIYPARAMQSRLFRLKGFSRAQLEEMLGSLRMSDKRYPLRYNERESTLLAYGPPRHIDVVAAALESLDAGATERNQFVVRVFPLRYAYAGDRTLGPTGKLPGVVSTIRSVYGAEPPEQTPAGGDNSGRAAVTEKMNALQVIFGGGGPAAPGQERKPPANEAQAAKGPPEKSSTGVSARGVRSPVNLEDDKPKFEADEANNAVIVHARLSKMGQYAELIRRLDVRPTLVELEATIIDVRADQMESLGINWSLKGTKGGVALGPTDSGLPADPTSAAKTAGMLSLGTVWTNAGRELLTRIDALQADGNARIVARPRVLGIANRAAHMQEKRVAAVRVAGNLDARLYQVEAGTLLQVTPQVITGPGASQIKLSIYIEDGNFESQTVDQVPVVKRTEIRTEAQVTEGESLLIGGITIETQANDQAGVPGLSKAPLFGGLFRWSSQRSTRTERLFLITPRIVRDAAPLLPPPAHKVPEPAEPPPEASLEGTPATRRSASSR